VSSDAGGAPIALDTSRLPTTAGLEEYHCDGDTLLTFVDQRGSEQQHGTTACWYAVHAETSISLAGNVAPDGSLVNEHATQPLALSVRARSQVLLI
jgi:hypothetical protein